MGGTAWSGGTGSSISVNASEWAVVYFYVEVTDDGCTEASETVVWDAWNFLPPSIASSGQSTYCVGESTVISNAFNGPSFFQWCKDGVLIPGADQSSYTVTESGTYTLSAAYADCPNYWQSSGVGPSFTFTSPTTPLITEMEGTLIADSGTSWQWILDGVDIPGATDSSYKTDGQEGMYQVRVTDANGCEATSAPFQFPEGPLAIELLGFSVDLSEDCNARIQWELSAESTMAQVSIEFSANGSDFETLKSMSASAKLSYSEMVSSNNAKGYLRLKMTDFNGEITYSPMSHVSTTCGLLAKSYFNIYPNPANEIVTLENINLRNGTLRVYNNTGQLILQQSILEATHLLEIAQWPNGVYQLVVEGADIQWTERLVKF